MTNEKAAEKLARCLVCDKIEWIAYETEVIESILLNTTSKQVCDYEQKQFEDSIPNTE